MFIVELEKDTLWLAPWSGDPGRTCIIENAKKYKTVKGAKIAIGIAMKYRKFKEAKVIPFTTHNSECTVTQSEIASPKLTS